MIRLTLTVGGETKTHDFQKPNVVIGDQGDLTLPNLEPIHVQITEDQGVFTATNQANDPFVSINSLPFRRKQLQQNDTIEIGEATIRFESTVEKKVVPEKITRPQQEELVQEILQKKLPSPKLSGERWQSHQQGRIHKTETDHFWDDWKVIAVLGCMVVMVITFIGAVALTRITEMNAEEEVIAAEGVSDIAMALMYAQVNNIQPRKHNWSDPEFVKNNLASLVTHDYPELSYINSCGRFTNCGYHLRTYTSNDFSQFLVIAQPAPSMYQWVAPRSAIVVDSKVMELRKIDDLKALNRMLVNPDSLEGPNAIEVTNLVMQGELIPLTTLATRRSYKGFTPPKALTLTHPGAENRIYNAPRYHQLGESIVQRSLFLMNNAEDQYEKSRLQQEIEVLAKLPSVVLYSSAGMETAMEMQRALTMVAPHEKFLTGYLKFNPKGNLISSHLIMDQAIQPVIPVIPKREFSVSKILAEAAQKIIQEALQPSNVEVKLEALRKERETLLHPTAYAISEQLQLALTFPDLVSSEQLQKLFQDFLEKDEELSAKITHALEDLQEEQLLPQDEFAQAVHQAGLTRWLQTTEETPDLEEENTLFHAEGEETLSDEVAMDSMDLSQRPF